MRSNRWVLSVAVGVSLASASLALAAPNAAAGATAASEVAGCGYLYSWDVPGPGSMFKWKACSTANDRVVWYGPGVGTSSACVEFGVTRTLGPSLQEANDEPNIWRAGGCPG